VSEVWKNVAAIVGSVLVTLAVAELALRSLWTSAPATVLMMSSPAMVMAGPGVVTYAPETLLRVATADQQGIIYDVKLRTNSLGLLDDEPTPASEVDRKIALVGDSFTAGYHGGQPWIASLRAHVPAEWKLYGMGVDGTGVQHFESLLKHIDPEVSFDRVFIVVIGNDFYRDHWYLTAGEDGVWFCRAQDNPQQCTHGRKPIIRHIAATASNDEVLATAAKARDLEGRSVRSLMVPTLIERAVAALLAPNSTERLSDAGVVANLGALERIVGRYGRERVAVIHLPALGEIRDGAYDLDLATFTAERHITYFPALTSCPFSESMFHAREPHPNASGYAHIAKCVEQFMRASLI
jgi:hypothetical protein